MRATQATAFGQLAGRLPLANSSGMHGGSRETYGLPGRSAGGTTKPRLVFFQWDHSTANAGFIRQHMADHVKCLEQHFDVVRINRDCDYAEICDRYEPDMALFESGYRAHGSRPIRISNTKAHPGVPKAGLHNGDAWCDRRAGFLSDMCRWGIGTYFAISTVVAEYTPEIWDDVFVWPNFIDPQVFKDYGLGKVQQVMLTGQVNGLYPWRRQVFPLLQDRYHCRSALGQGYDGVAASQSLFGEAYARAINQSFVVPTCGTMGKDVVRKHFEIPAAGACLITERSPSLEAAGFVDMENCVFVDRTDIVDRLDYLFANEDELRRITEAGTRLVHARHTVRDRPQIYEWFELQRSPGEENRVVQREPFGPLRLVKREIGGALPARYIGRQRSRSARRGRSPTAAGQYTASTRALSKIP